MASHGEQVVLAFGQLLKAAFGDPRVERDAPWPKRPLPEGQIIFREGERGDPVESFSPRSFTFQHQMEVEVFGPEGSADRHELLDGMLTILDTAIEGNQSLGGLCAWLEVSSEVRDDVATDNGQPRRAARLTVMAEYTTSSRLG
jgi:hypothetical protein